MSYNSSIVVNGEIQWQIVETYWTVIDGSVQGENEKMIAIDSMPSLCNTILDRQPVKKILILAVNPPKTAWLRLDDEIREIVEGLRRSKYRDQFAISSIRAVGFRDLRRALLDFEPNIVHFTGHWSVGGLLVEDERGFPTRISTATLSALFELFSDIIECVILSACYSARQATAINKHIDYVIGMLKEIKDYAAIEFSVGFYDALGAGKSVEEAFRFGCSAIQMMSLPEYLIPVLEKRST